MTLQSYQVLQRNADNVAEITLANGEHVTLPVGGPYTLEGQHDILVGDLWLLAGQSNMEGVGNLIDVESPQEMVHSLQSCETWAIATEPLHWLNESPRSVHRALMGLELTPDSPAQRDPARTKGAGLGLTFAKTRYAATGIPIGLIPAAHGGTSMEQWDPRRKDDGDASLYGAALGRVHQLGGKIAGILWYQGESDASPDQATLYPFRLQRLVAAFRADLAQPDLPFYFVQIGRVIGEGWIWEPSWNAIRELQRLSANTLAGSRMVSTVDLELDDLIHIGTQGLKRLGRRLATVANGEPAPDLAAVEFDATNARIIVTFRGLRGPLQSAGLPTGFTLRRHDGTEVPMIFKVTLEGERAILHLVADPLPEATLLWYGWGANPNCNLTDAADASVPAFGPIALPRGAML